MCPACSVASGRVHPRYQRRLADLPVAGRRVELCLTAELASTYSANGFCSPPRSGQHLWTIGRQHRGRHTRRHCLNRLYTNSAPSMYVNPIAGSHRRA
ncbi:transposase family protein [Couchioplanes caeruleus]|uniref:transposase family protein n=1 Tax=Couchioplanes caeruleus TaxID=56438 RepID=UPI003CC82E7A